MKEKFKQKKFRLQEYLKHIEQLAPECAERFSTDFVYRGALLHYLYLTADSCISLAEMKVRAKNLRPPQSYAESFLILGENGVLEPEFAKSFSKIAGFRNFLAHDYDMVDAELICREVLQNLQDIHKFLHLMGEL